MPDEKAKLVHEFADAFNRRDLARMKELCDPEFQFAARLAAVEGRIYRGHGGVAEFLEDFMTAFSEFQVVPEEIIDAGANRVVIFMEASGVSKETHVPVRQPFAHFWRLRGGKFWIGESYATRSEAMEAAGLEDPTVDA